MKYLVFLAILFSGCANRGFIRKEIYENGSALGGLAVCSMKQQCLESAESFCFPKKVCKQIFYEEIQERPYYDQGFGCWRAQAWENVLLEFRCCQEN